jgi:hypothetical protein
MIKLFPERENRLSDATVQRLLTETRALLGKPYRFWHPDLDFKEVQYMDPDSAPDDPPGLNCTSLYNWVLCKKFGISPPGGTSDWGNAITNWEYFNLNKNYPPGTFLVCPFSDDINQGHVALTSTAEDTNHNQWMLQSDHSMGVSGDGYWGWKGVNEDWTMAQTQSWSNFIWAGYVDGIPVLDGFPGYTAPGRLIAEWCADCMDFFGLPRHYFVMCSMAELTTIWTDDRPATDIRVLEGYSYAVDHNSVGPAQQQTDWWPLPWDFPTAVWSFSQAMKRYLDGSATPTDQWGSAQAIQGVQQSAFSDGSNYARHYEWAIELTQQEKSPILVPDSSPVAVSAPVGGSVQQGTAAQATAPAPSEIPSSSTSPTSTAPAPPPPEEEPNWFGIGADGIMRIGSAATDWSQGWLWEDPDDHKLRFIHQKPPAKAPGKGE